MQKNAKKCKKMRKYAKICTFFFWDKIGLGRPIAKMAIDFQWCPMIIDRDDKIDLADGNKGGDDHR